MRTPTCVLSWFTPVVLVTLAGGGPAAGQEASPASACDAIEQILGRCGPPNASSHWLKAILEEHVAERSVERIFPPEPEGLIVTGTNRKVSAGVTQPLSETAIAVSPQDPRRIAIGANTDSSARPFQSMFVSVDGGKKFRASLLPATSPTYFLQGDPSVTWTSNGQLWAATIEGQVTAGKLSLKGLAYRTTNAGATWVPMGAYSGTETLADRPTIWADTSATSAFKDSIYVTWHNGPVYVTRRRKGAANWAKPVRVSPLDASGFGGDLKTDATGRIYVFWPDRTQMKIFVSTSSDGGVRFTPPVAVAPITNHLFDLSVPPAGRNPGNYVTTAALSRDGTRWAFAAWMDRAVGDTGPARIWFSSSRDGGATWSTAIHVAPRNDASAQFHAALTVDSQSGRLAVVYSDNAADPAGSKVHRSVVTSNDFGVTWSSPQRITTVPSNALTDPEQIYGDYQGSFALGPRLWTVWTDRRTGAASSVWMAELRVTESGARAVEIGEPTVEKLP